jgi:hypothetical protein
LTAPFSQIQNFGLLLAIITQQKQKISKYPKKETTIGEYGCVPLLDASPAAAILTFTQQIKLEKPQIITREDNKTALGEVMVAFM